MMAEPQAIYDRRDTVGTLPDMVALPRDLAERALAALRASMTSAGHLAQRVGHEHLGYCGWRSESERCVAQRKLIEELQLALSEPVRLAALAQGELRVERVVEGA